VINTKCSIDTVISPDDGHIVARNMYRKEINVLRKVCTKLALFTRKQNKREVRDEISTFDIPRL